jgi:hypothetical protein
VVSWTPGVRVTGVRVTGELDLSNIHAHAVLDLTSSVFDTRCELSYAHLSPREVFAEVNLVELHTAWLQRPAGVPGLAPNV